VAEKQLQAPSRKLQVKSRRDL